MDPKMMAQMMARMQMGGMPGAGGYGPQPQGGNAYAGAPGMPMGGTDAMGRGSGREAGMMDHMMGAGGGAPAVGGGWSGFDPQTLALIHALRGKGKR